MMTCTFCYGVGEFLYRIWKDFIPDHPTEVRVNCQHCDGKGYVYHNQEDKKCAT